MRILVTGGAGFIGSHLARELARRDHEVVVVDNLSNGRRDNVPDGCLFLESDLGRPEALESLPDVDAVVHFAAQSSGPASGQIPYADLQSNSASTLLLSRWCIARGISRFVYASSMAVYGNPERLPVTEDAPCVPRSYYGVSKLASEHMLRIAAYEGLQPTCLRFFSVYGPGQNLVNLQQGIVSIYLAYLLSSDELPVTGSLDRFRDLVHVDDVVRLCAAVVEAKSTPEFVYNVGGGVAVRIRELIEALRRAVGASDDFPVRELSGSPSDQFGLYADISRVARDFDWSPRVELRTGLDGMVEWARQSL